MDKRQQGVKMKEHERRMRFAREKSAQAWCTKTTENITMIPELAEEFAEILVKEMYEPKLGCATTREMFEELMARNCDLDYKTINE